MSLTGFPRPRRWRAQWIWGDTQRGKNLYQYFRRCFTAGGPVPHRLFIAADTRYQLFINGQFAGRGAPQSQPFFQYYDEYSVGEYLQRGANCIAVVVNHTGTLADTRPGLLAELVDADGGTVLATDSSWLSQRAAAWQQNTHAVPMNKAVPFQEFYDARRAPVGWEHAEFDDSGWSRAVEIRKSPHSYPPANGPWSRLVPRDIPFMEEFDVFPEAVQTVEESLDVQNRSRRNDLAPGLSLVGRPLKRCRAEAVGQLCGGRGEAVLQSSTEHLDSFDFDGLYAPAVVFDFGRVITARCSLELTGKAGGIVDIGYAERLIDGHFNIAQECEFADRYVMRDGEQTFTSFTWKAFRYLKVRFRSCFEPVTVRAVKAVITRYPFEDRGRFESGDELLNQVFDISRYTVRLCSNEFLMDTPWREQAQWLGDVALVTIPAVYSCFGDTALPGKFIRQAATNQHPTGMISNVSNTVNHAWQNAIPDYSLWWVRGLWEHYLYTGEDRWLTQFYPQALRVIYAHLDYVNDHGMIENMPYWVFVDWADVETAGECAPYTAVFYDALEAVQRMAQFKNDAHATALTDGLMKRIRQNFQSRFFDAERGCFADAVLDDGLSAKASEHANAGALYWSLCDRRAAARVIETVFEDRQRTITEAQPFFMAVVLEALRRHGRMDLALKLMRERWGGRMVEKGMNSCLEEWYENGSWRTGEFTGFLRSHSHAWSAFPAAFLVRNLIGLDILEPGCGKIRLSPYQGDLEYTVTYPTPQGAVSVEKRGSTITVSAPDAVDVHQA